MKIQSINQTKKVPVCGEFPAWEKTLSFNQQIIIPDEVASQCQSIVEAYNNGNIIILDPGAQYVLDDLLGQPILTRTSSIGTLSVTFIWTYPNGTQVRQILQYADSTFATLTIVNPPTVL